MEPDDVVAIERALLGAMILDNAGIDDALGVVREADFIARKHRVVFQAIARMSGDGTPVTMLTLADDMGDHGELDEIGGAATIAAMTTESSADGSPVRDLARRVASHAMKRRVVQGLTEILEGSRSMSAQDMLAKVELVAAAEDRESSEYGLMSEHIRNVMRDVDDLMARGGELAGLSTGLTAIDRYTLGLQDGDLVVIGARASIGKTALALTIASNIAKREPVGFISLEMSARQLTRRGLSMHSGVDVTKITTGSVQEGDVKRLVDAGSVLADRKMYILDRPRAFLPEILATARRMKRRDKIRALFVDYVGLIRVSGIQNRHEQISFAAKEMKQLARDLDIPVVLLAQLNRQAEGKRPTLAELKESGALEEDADMVILLHRDREAESCRADAYIEKNRNGQTGHAQVGFSRELTLFRDLLAGEDDSRESV